MSDIGKQSIIQKSVANYTEPTSGLPKAYWQPEKFEQLIYDQGYDAYIDRALRCPCVDKSTGQANSTCQNCLGRGWLFVDRRETRLIAQSMDNKRRFQDWSEINQGMAWITARAVDRMGFMDRVVLMDLEAWYTEILKPRRFENRLLAYPIYEPLEISNILLYVGDGAKLQPLSPSQYEVEGNHIWFDESVQDSAPINDFNQTEPIIHITIRYSYHPVFHILDADRELMKVRPRNCSYSDDDLFSMPVHCLARKAHYLYGEQRYNDNLFENTVASE